MNPEDFSHYSGMQEPETRDSAVDKISTMANRQGDWESKTIDTWNDPAAEKTFKSEDDPSAEKAKGAALTQSSLTQVSSVVVFKSTDTKQMLFE